MVFESMVQRGASALFVNASPFFTRQRKRLVALAARNAIPEKWLHGHIEIERKFLTDSIGAALAMIRQQLRDEFTEQIGQLRAEFTLANAHTSRKVIDLPNPLAARKRDAA
jgi:hypothetical protein